MTTTFLAVTAAQATPPARPDAARTSPDETAARRLAMTSATRVEVESRRTEYTQMFAEPTGRFTVESAVVPQRIRRDDGSWADIDLTLSARPDGTVRPEASAADVRLSDGGLEPLVTLVKAGRTFTVGWPLGRLPEPTLAGPEATYANVLPDVDLVVRATTDGFSHVLVVHTAAAAAESELKTITFDLGGDAQVRRGRDGSFAAVVGDATLASAPAPAMWDSAAAPATAGARSGPLAVGDPSSAAAPADTAKIAAVATELTSTGDLVLRPDPALLSKAVLPLYIDPAWSTGKTRWAYSTNDNGNNTDLTRARVGKDPRSSKVYRSYFEFPTTAIKGRYVYDAYVQMKLDHSASCANSPNTLFSSNPITGTPRSAWKATNWYLRNLATVSSHANEESCPDAPQPDVTVNFNTDGVKSVVQNVATAGSASATFVFSAVDSSVAGESDDNRWKKYYTDNARLITDVDWRPTAPTEFYVNGVRCGSGTLGIGTTALRFSARMPDKDTTQAIRATWEWQRLNGTAWTAMTAPAVSSAAANTTATTAILSGAANGQTYRFRVKGTDPSPYNQSSAFSAYCTFKIDTSDPTVTGTVNVQPAGPGKPGKFLITSNDADLVKFRWGWNAAINDVTPTSSVVSGGVTTKSVELTLSPPKYGLNTLYLQGVDTTANVGDGSLTFTVDRASPPVAKWGLESYPGVTTADALADQQPSVAGSTPLTANAVTWTDKQRLVGGVNATFAGAGSLTTAGGVLDTTKSYGVAAWVRLDSLAAFQNIVAQDGANTTNFQLQFRNDNVDGVAGNDQSFCFTMRNTDVAVSAPGTFTCAANTAVAGRWTHVAATYDAAEKLTRIWVDGVLKQEKAAGTAWASSGPLRIGNRMLAPADYIDGVTGSIADVQVFDRALVAEDLTGDQSDATDAVDGERGMLAPVEVARWDFDDAAECYDTTIDGACEEPDGTQFGRRLALTQGVMIGSGPTGGYGLFDSTLPDQPGVVTFENGRSQRNSGTWQDAPVLRTDQSFTATALLHLDSVDTTMAAIAPKGMKQSAFHLGTRLSTVGGVTAQRFEVMIPNADAGTGVQYSSIVAPDALVIDDAGTWHRLTVVYDAGAKRIKLYVNGELKQSGVQNAAWNAPGPVLIGSSWYTPDNGASYLTDAWQGGIDDVRLFQGAMTDAQVAALL